MGTAIIESHLGGGKYRVRLQFDNTIIAQRIANIDARLAEIAATLADLSTEKAAAKIKLDADVLALNIYIDATPQQDYAANPAQIDSLTAALNQSRADYDLIVTRENRENTQKKSLEKEKAYLQTNCPAEITTDIWCVQLVTNLSGTIKTLECDYGLERDPDTNAIQFDTGCWLPYQPETPESKLQHPFASSQHAVWYNLCVLPAAQRDKARYRVATLLDVATGRIQFDGQTDTEQYTHRYFNKKPIFPVIAGAQREIYDGAEIYYPCGMAALYINGDRVIVDLHGGVGVPTVIGFYSNPRECVPDGGGGNDSVGSAFVIVTPKPVIAIGHDVVDLIVTPTHQYREYRFNGSTWLNYMVAETQNPLTDVLWDMMYDFVYNFNYLATEAECLAYWPDTVSVTYPGSTGTVNQPKEVLPWTGSNPTFYNYWLIKYNAVP